MFDFTDKAFNQMSFTVKVPINLALKMIVTARWNDCMSASFSNSFNKRA